MAFSRLGRVLDIEWLLQRDEGRREDDTAAHDRRLLQPDPPADAERALARWLEGRRAELDHRTLGVRVSELLTGVHVVLVVLAGAAGVGTAEALLEDAASRVPTNVLSFVFATLVWPLGLLLASLVLFMGRGRLGRSVVLEDAYQLLLGVASRLAARGAAESGDLAREWRRLRRSARRYRDIEVGTLIAAAQWYPMAFHLGAAASLTTSALFSDLAFSWSTTDASISADTVTTVARALTAPWCSTLGVGCVSPELVRATQFSRFAGEYVAPDGVIVSGAWWSALLGCLLVYGVLPRLVFGLVVSGLVARRSSRLSERVLELRARLRAGTELAPPAPSSLDGAEAAPLGEPRAPAATLASRECWVIRWRAAPLDADDARALCRRLGLTAVRQDLAGGSDFEADLALIDGSGPPDRAVVIAVEGWEAPDKATRRFMQALRARGNAERPIFVAVIVRATDAPELAVWRDRMRLLEDPFLSVHAVVTSEAAAPPEVMP